MKTVFWKAVDVQQVIDQAIELNTISRKGGVKDVEEACKRPEMYPFSQSVWCSPPTKPNPRRWKLS